MKAAPSDDGRPLREWFAAACDLPEEEWEGFLTEGCSDPALRSAVLDLLRRDRRGALPLRRPVAAEALRVVLADDEAALPGVIGPYRVDGLLGRGAMGTVYEAVHADSGARVALKVLRSALPNEALVARFRREAAALARLDHPAIARILDTGTAQLGAAAVPFIAMELVRGRPLDVYCATHGLDSRARLRLLLAVTEAVEHAHRRGVIHRDLKPANVLVDDEGRPHVLDFGVARTLAGDEGGSSLHTGTGMLLGTLQYMSPEQTQGDPAAVDERCDVYALGVLAYELLAGRPPYDVSDCSLDQALRRVLHADPVPLGRLATTLRGDVSVVVGRALEKDPEQRYASVADLASDLRAALESRPIRARAPGLVDQLQRLNRRQPRLVAGVVAFVVVLLLGIVGTAWGWWTAARHGDHVAALLQTERLHAARAGHAVEEMGLALDESRVVVDFLHDLFGSLRSDEMGGQVRLADVLALASPRVDESFADQPRVAGRLHHTLGVAWQSVGAFDRALVHHGAAERLLTGRGGAADDLAVQAALNRGTALMESGELDAAAAELAELAARLEGADRRRAVQARLSLARAQLHGGDAGSAGQNLERLIDEGGHVPGVDVLLDEDVRLAWAEVLLARGQPVAAEAVQRDVLGARRQRLGDEHVETLDVGSHLSQLLVTLGRPDEAEPLLTERARVFTERLGPDHPQSLHALGRLANLWYEQDRVEEALPLLEDLLPRARRVLGPEHPRTVSLLVTLSAVAVACGRPDADSLVEEALVLGRAVLEDTHPNLVTVLSNAAIQRFRRGLGEEGLALLREAAELCHRPEGGVHIADRVLVEVNLCAVLLSLGRSDEALPVLDAVQPLAAQGLGARHPQSISLLTYRGDACRLEERWDDAERHYLAVLDLELGKDHENTLMALAGLGDVWVRSGRAEQGVPLLSATRDHVSTVLPAGNALERLIDEALAHAAGLAGGDD